MNITKTFIAVTAGVVTQFLLEWVLYGMLYEPIMGKSPMGESAPEEPNFLFLVLSYVFFCILLAYIYDRWANIKTFATGASAGATIGLLIALMVTFSMSAMKEMVDWSANIYSLVASGIVSAMAGGVVAHMLGRD